MTFGNNPYIYSYNGVPAHENKMAAHLKIIRMAAYVIVEISIHDMETYREYTLLTPQTIADHGGRFVVRGGQTESLEGDWHPQRIVVLEFPDMGQARAWYDSQAYAEAKKLRQMSARTKMILVPGV